MGEELETTYISIDGITAREWRPTWVRSDVYVSPTQQFYNDLCTIDVTSINGMQDFLKQEKKEEEKRQIEENFYKLTEMLEKQFFNRGNIPF